MRVLDPDRVTVLPELFGLVELVYKQRDILPPKAQKRIDRIRERVKKSKAIVVRDQIWIHGIQRAIQCDWFKAGRERA